METDSDRKVIHEARSPFGTVYVVDMGDQRTLRFDSPYGTLQSIIRKSDPLAVPTSYVRVATAGLAFTRGRSRALVVGLGGGTFPMLLHRLLPHMVVDVVELNPVVVEVATRFFGVREDSRLRIMVEDGARFMARQSPRYDLIFLDAFSNSGTPDHLKEALFLEDVRRRLEPGGVAVINIALEEPQNEASRLDTFARAFEGCVQLRGTPNTNNLILVGTLEPPPSEPQFWHQLWRLGRELGFMALTQSVESFQRNPRP